VTGVTDARDMGDNMPRDNIKNLALKNRRTKMGRLMKRQEIYPARGITLLGRHNAKAPVDFSTTIIHTTAQRSGAPGEIRTPDLLVRSW